MSTYIITAIDTDAGKTYITGLLARLLYQKNVNVMTMKMAQTGCVKTSEDIEKHREIMGVPMHKDDFSGDTCPYIFHYPASPHLAAEMDGSIINPEKIINKITSLSARYETLLVEGVGGLMVPLTRDYLVADLLQEVGLPTILVTSGKLGSINHTLLSLEVMKNRNIPLYGIIYNNYPKGDSIISDESKIYLKKKLSEFYPDALWEEMPAIDESSLPSLSFPIEEWFK